MTFSSSREDQFTYKVDTRNRHPQSTPAIRHVLVIKLRLQCSSYVSASRLHSVLATIKPRTRQHNLKIYYSKKKGYKELQLLLV